MGLRITEKMPKHPRGGTMFLLNTSTFNRGPDQHDGHQQGQNIADGYMWTEILHQSDLITSKENHLDYRHYYISTSLGDGRRRRTSSKFRHSQPEWQNQVWSRFNRSVWYWGNLGVARCREMATLPAGYIPQHKVPLHWWAAVGHWISLCVCSVVGWLIVYQLGILSLS